MSQWVEIRHLYLVEGVAKKRIARRLQLDIKTVRRALERRCCTNRHWPARRPPTGSSPADAV